MMSINRWTDRKDLDQSLILRTPDMEEFVMSATSVRSVYDYKSDSIHMPKGTHAIDWRSQPNGLITVTFAIAQDQQWVSPHFGTTINRHGSTEYCDLFEYHIDGEWYTWASINSRFPQSPSQ
jgi:hypothetical protein